jgi:hypothetical protein
MEIVSSQIIEPDDNPDDNPNENLDDSTYENPDVKQNGNAIWKHT